MLLSHLFIGRIWTRSPVFAAGACGGRITRQSALANIESIENTYGDVTHPISWDITGTSKEFHLDYSTNRGDSGDPYPGSSNNNSFNDLTYPNNDNYSENSSLVEISNIQENNGIIELQLSIPERNGQVISYDSGISGAYGYPQISEYTYGVYFTAPEGGYLRSVDVGLYANVANVNINIYDPL